MRGEQYLTKPKQFELVYNEGNSWANNLVIMRARPNELTLSRYGFSISRRVGKAVVRNRVKRLLREILRRMSLKSGWDIIFIARSQAANADYVTLKKSVEALLSRARLLTREYEEIGLRTN